MYNKIEKSSPIEDPTDFVNLVGRTMDMERANPGDFEGVVNEYELEDVEKATRNKEAKLRGSKQWGTALLGEWVVLEGIKSGWFGEAEVEPQPASKYDDYMRGIDIICEFPMGGEVVPLAIDVTTADPQTSSNKLLASAVIVSKLESIVGRAKGGKHAGLARLFKSKYGREEERAVGRKEMLKVVVAISPEDVIRLAALSRGRLRQDAGALARLRGDAFRQEFLAQIQGAVEFAREGASRAVRKSGNSTEDINTASQIIGETEEIGDVIAKAAGGSGLVSQNPLFDMVFKDAVPKELTRAIQILKATQKAEELDELLLV